MKELTIIIPGYNIEKFLDKIMKSLLVEDIIDNLEVIIVNDGSKDNTLKKAEVFSNAYPLTVKVIDKENGGHGSTINEGVKHASGRYIKVIDGDDWVSHGSIGKLINFIKDCNADIIAANYTIYNEKTGKSEIREYSGIEYGKEYSFADVCNRIDFIEFHSMIYSNEILQKDYRMIDEHCFYVDTEHVIFPLVNVNTIMFFSTPFYVYRIGDTNQSVSISSFLKNRDQLKRVLIRLIDFYNENDEIDERIKEYIKKRIKKIMDVCYSVLLRIPEIQVARSEIMELDKSINSKSKEFYNERQTRYKMLEAANYHGIRALRFVISVYKLMKSES